MKQAINRITSWIVINSYWSTVGFCFCFFLYCLPSLLVAVLTTLALVVYLGQNQNNHEPENSDKCWMASEAIQHLSLDRCSMVGAMMSQLALR